MKRSLPHVLLALALAVPVSVGSIRPADAATSLLSPDASGTIRSIPGLGVFDRAPVGDAIQSTYFNTTGTNREFRRGFFEFAIPPCTGVQSATLTLREGGGFTSFPFDPDIHELASYAPADLSVTTEDYGSGALLATFETDRNVDGEVSSFDVQALVSGVAGGTIGFRVKLAADPARTSLGTAGEGFVVTLEIVCGTLTPSEVAGLVDDLVDDGALTAGQGSALNASLDAAAASIAADNITAAVNQLKAFIKKVEAAVKAGWLSASAGADLIAAAEAIIAELGAGP